MYTQSRWVRQGGLMSYAADIVEMRRRAATFADKIFKGAKPAELPVEQPTKFELIVNLKTAKTMGITIPRAILLRAAVPLPFSNISVKKDPPGTVSSGRNISTGRFYNQRNREVVQFRQGLRLHRA